MYDLTVVVSELGTFFEAQALGTVGKDIFLLSMPKSPLQCIAILIPGGPHPRGDPLPRPSLQLLVRGRSDQIMPALLRAQSIFRLLDHNVPPPATVRARVVPGRLAG